MLCEYGCGQEALYQFGSGKWCCSKHTSSCPVVKQKRSNKMKGKIPWNKGKINVYSETVLFNMGSGFRGKNHSLETRRKMSKSKIGQPPWIKGKKHTKVTKEKIGNSLRGKKLSKEVKYNMSKNNYNRLTIEQLQEQYPTFYKDEEMRYNPNKLELKEIQTHCKNSNCKNSKENGGWFTPARHDLNNRRYAIENENGFEGYYLYCSTECKNECPLYRNRVSTLIKQDQINIGIIEDPWYTSSEYLTWRTHIFNLDNNKCVYCEKPAEHAHHILPQKIYPNLALDLDNGIACCSECHYKYGHRDPWCTTGYLSQVICERIIRIKEKIEK